MRKRRPPNPHVLVGANRIQYDTADVFVVGITHRDGCTRNMSRKLCLNHRNSKLGLYQVLHRFDGEITETEGYSRFFGQSERRQTAARRGSAAAGTAGAGARDRHLRRHPARGRRPLRLAFQYAMTPYSNYGVGLAEHTWTAGHLSEPGEGLGRGGRRQKAYTLHLREGLALLGRRAVHRRRHHVLVGSHRTDGPHLSRPVHAHHHLHRPVRERGQDRRLHRARRIQQAVRQPVLGALRQGGPRPPEEVFQPVPSRVPGRGQAGRRW